MHMHKNTQNKHVHMHRSTPAHAHNGGDGIPSVLTFQHPIRVLTFSWKKDWLGCIGEVGSSRLCLLHVIGSVLDRGCPLSLLSCGNCSSFVVLEINWLKDLQGDQPYEFCCWRLAISAVTRATARRSQHQPTPPHTHTHTCMHTKQTCTYAQNTLAHAHTKHTCTHVCTYICTDAPLHMLTMQEAGRWGREGITKWISHAGPPT